ncbi:MAG: hydrogenase expression/formation protein HypE [Saccharofermentanales bacterium]
MKITMAHGSGGKETSDLIKNLFVRYLGNPVLSGMEDSAVVPGAGKISITTDSFVVTPLFFPGGDIGKLAVCGTVNDLSMSGSTPKYITCGFILEEGTDYDELEKIVVSMAQAADEAGVSIVAGDTKVIEGKGGIYINTSGVGFFEKNNEMAGSIRADNCENGDIVILSGDLGDHHAAILSARMSIINTIRSDCAPLNGMTESLLGSGAKIKAMRDVTRGGLATILHEIAEASSCNIILQESQIPLSDQVKSFCGILGLDPLYMGNEGKMIVVTSKEDAQSALECMKRSRYGQNASIIGEIIKNENDFTGMVFLKTTIGGTRTISELYGEGLPRIC